MVRPTAKNASRILTKMMQKYKSPDASKLLDGFGYHLITKNYAEHRRLHNMIFTVFSGAPNNTMACPNGWTLSIQKVKLTLTEIENQNPGTSLKYQYEDDKIIFNARAPDGHVIHLEQIAMPLKIYLDKCVSHLIYNFTRLFGRKEGNDFHEALAGHSLGKIEKHLPTGDMQSSEVASFECPASWEAGAEVPKTSNGVTPKSMWAAAGTKIRAAKMFSSMGAKRAATLSHKFAEKRESLPGFKTREHCPPTYVWDQLDAAEL